jgi:4-alpha-glucanotransferase
MMADFAGIEIDHNNLPAYDFSIQWKLIDSLLASRSRYAALMITDLFGMVDRFNKPGTVGHENWSYRLPFTVADLKQDPEKQQHIVRLLRSIEQNQRTPEHSPTFLGIG